MFVLIPIVPATVDLIEQLNDGVRPEIEDGETFYVWRGDDKESKIVTRNEVLTSDEYPEWMAVTQIFYRGD